MPVPPDRRNRAIGDPCCTEHRAVLTVALAIVAVAAIAMAFACRLAFRRERSERLRVESRARSLDSFASYVESATERDRADIAREMHDQIGGLLVATKMDLDWIARRLPSGDDAARGKLTQVSSSLDSGLTTKRRLVERLRPSILDHLGLFAALQWQLTELCSAASVECSAKIPDDDPEFSPDAAIRVFRLEHDAIARAIAAPEVSLIELDVRVVGDTLELHVTDDGVGADTSASDGAPASLLWSLKHRAESLGGTCSAERRPDGGTRLHVRIPVSRLARR